MTKAVPGQIWQDDCYYYDQRTGRCMRKYVLVLAIDARSGDSVTAVLTSTPNGLPTDPACWQGNPRSGYYLGIPGAPLVKETWIDFNGIQTLDDADLAHQVAQARKNLLALTLLPDKFCAVLRCVRGIDDLEIRHERLIGDLIAVLGCS